MDDPQGLGSIEREFTVVIPDSATSDVPQPLWFYFHGQSGNGFQSANSASRGGQAPRWSIVISGPEPKPVARPTALRLHGRGPEDGGRVLVGGRREPGAGGGRLCFFLFSLRVSLRIARMLSNPQSAFRL